MKLLKTSDSHYITDDDLVEVYQVPDGSWRVAYFPWADRDRNLTLQQAMSLAEVRHEEAKKLKGYL